MSFYKGYKDGYGRYVEIFKNPSHTEVRKVESWTEHGTVRAFLILDGTLFVWDSYANLHTDVDLELGLRGADVVPLVLSDGIAHTTDNVRGRFGGKVTDLQFNLNKRSECQAIITKNKKVLETALGGKFRATFYGE